MSDPAQKAQQLIDENAVSMFSPSNPKTIRPFESGAPLKGLTDFAPSPVVFSKSYCPFCLSSKRTLDGYGAKYHLYELNKESDGAAIQDALQQISGQRTVPNIFINRKHIGGNSELQQHDGSDLEQLLKEAGAI